MGKNQTHRGANLDRSIERRDRRLTEIERRRVLKRRHAERLLEQIIRRKHRDYIRRAQ